MQPGGGKLWSELLAPGAHWWALDIVGCHRPDVAARIVIGMCEADDYDSVRRISRTLVDTGRSLQTSLVSEQAR
jgi:hypothetical protein